MTKLRQEKVEELVQNCLASVNKAKITKEELIAFLSQVLMRTGYSLYYVLERPHIERPQIQLTSEAAERLWLRDPTAGSSLLKLGFDIVETLLVKERKET